MNFHHRKSKRTRNGDFLSLVRVLVSLRACEQTYINLPVTKRGESKSTVDTNSGINPRRKCDGRVSRQMNNRRARRCYPHFLAKLSRDRVIIITLASCKGEKGDDGCIFLALLIPFILEMKGCVAKLALIVVSVKNLFSQALLFVEFVDRIVRIRKL